MASAYQDSNASPASFVSKLFGIFHFVVGLAFVSMAVYTGALFRNPRVVVAVVFLALAFLVYAIPFFRRSWAPRAGGSVEPVTEKLKGFGFFVLALLIVFPAAIFGAVYWNEWGMTLVLVCLLIASEIALMVLSPHQDVENG
jgi:hypothetical protein